MIIEEYKSGATLIRFDDRDIGTKENEKDIMDMLLSLILKNFQNTLK